jgi:RluA family pseudouridine synthase
MVTIELTEQDAGHTALDILQQRIPAASQSYLRQLLRRGKVFCADIALNEDSRLHGHETLQLPDSGRLRELCASPLPQLTILLETDDFLAVFKPAGLAIHSSVNHTENNLTDQLRSLMRHRRAPYQVAPVHRLDIGTSGPVLFGKGRKATAELGRLLQAGQIRKTYLALVHGTPPESGTLTTEIQVQDKIKQAATRYRVLGRHDNAALLELELLSGRKHQIRQQCSHAGWPVYGDSRYGGPALASLDRLFLHCWQLAWSTGVEPPHFCVSSPLPGDLRNILGTMHIDLPLPT